MRLFLYVLYLGFVLYTFIDCARTPQDQITRGPKWLWLLLIFFFEGIGSLSWIFFGRPRRSGGNGPRRPKKFIAPDDNPDFLGKL